MIEDELLELSDPQYDFLESSAKHTGFVAGFGSGKSFIGTLKSLMRIIDFKIPKTAYYLTLMFKYLFVSAVHSSRVSCIFIAARTPSRVSGIVTRS